MGQLDPQAEIIIIIVIIFYSTHSSFSLPWKRPAEVMSGERVPKGQERQILLNIKNSPISEH